MKLNKKMTKHMQAYSDAVVLRILEDFVIDRAKVDFPVIKVVDGKSLRGEDRGCMGVYDPATNEIHLAYDKTATEYEEYDKLADSPLLGNVKGDAKLCLNILFYHELAHWMTDFILKSYSHKHGKAFKICYGYLRRTYCS